MVSEDLLENAAIFASYAMQWALPETERNNSLAKDLVNSYNDALNNYIVIKGLVDEKTQMGIYEEDDITIELNLLNLGIASLIKTGTISESGKWSVLTTDMGIIKEDKDTPLQLVIEYSNREIGRPPMPVHKDVFPLGLFNIHITKSKIEVSE